MKQFTEFSMGIKAIVSRSAIVAFIMFAGTSPAGAQFGDIADRLMIQDIWARYIITMDSGDADGYAALFTEDATLNVNNIDIIHGRKEIHAMIQRMAQMLGMEANAFGPMRHIATSLVLDIDGDTATANSYWMEVMPMEGMPPSIFNVGRYEDKFVKLDGQWFFSERVILADTGYVPDLGSTEN